MSENEKDNVELEVETIADDQILDSELEEDELTSKQKIINLQAKLKACEAERRSQFEELQRERAGFLNSKQLLKNDLIRAQDRIVEHHIEQLIPLCDSFTMAMRNQEVWRSVDNAWRAGFEGIFNQLKSILDEYGVKTLEPKDELFDPEKHEAIDAKDVTDKAPDQIIEVLQPGYERKGIILRPAKVIISK